MLRATDAGSAGPPVVEPSALHQLRVAVALFFGLGGFLFAGWAVRIPTIKEQVNASASQLGLALLCISVAAVATMTVTGWLCQRFGGPNVTIATAALLCVSVVPPTFTHSPLALGAVLLLFGVAYGGIDVAVNSVAVDLIAAVDRPMMPGFHAANSIGSLVGAGVGGLLAPLLSPSAHMLLVAPIGLVATVFGARLLWANPLPRVRRVSGGASGRLSRRIRTHVILLSIVALCAAYCQGALDNWVPLHVIQDLGQGSGIAGAAYFAVTLSLTVGRLCGARLLVRFGQIRVIGTGGLAAAGGVLVAALAPHTWLVFVGLVVTGLGLANIFPMALARAGASGGPNGIAMASTFGYGGILLAPPTIGFLADAFDLSRALTIIAPVVAFAAILYCAVPDRPDGTPDELADSAEAVGRPTPA